MQILRFVELDDAGRVVLRGDDEQSYALDIDERLLAAIRREHGPAQRGSTMDDLRPRDIQAKVRSGVSPEEIAEQAGVPLERVQRYARPVLHEREHVADSARQVLVRSGGVEAPLAELVEARLVEQGVETDGADGDGLRWDAWRREDGRWTVEVRFIDETGSRSARWSYDPHTRSVAVDDETARALTDGGKVARDVPPDSAAPPPRRLLSVPDLEPADDGTYDETEIADELAALGLQPVDSDAEPTPSESPRDRLNDTLTLDLDDDGAPAPAPAPAAAADDAPVEQPATEKKPAKKAARRSKRASVPSWDDIVFGARKPE